MPFRFRLESVLSYRRQLEEALQLDLARLEHTYREEQRVMDALHDRKERHLDNLANRQRPGAQIDVEWMALGFAYVERLDKSIEQQAEVLAEVAARVNEKRGEVMKAMQDRKALENLKDRERRRYIEWVNQVEARELDEIATTQHNRRLRAAAEEGGNLG